MDVYENLSSSKLDDDVKISVVLREAPQKLRDYLLVNSQQFERAEGDHPSLPEHEQDVDRERLQRNRSYGGGLHRQGQRQKQEQEQRQK